MQRRQVPAAVGRKPGNPFHAEQVIAAVGSGASKICRHRMRERSIGPRMERDLRWQLGIIDQRDHRPLREAQPLVERRHRLCDIVGVEVSERTIRDRGHGWRV